MHSLLHWLQHQFFSQRGRRLIPSCPSILCLGRYRLLFCGLCLLTGLLSQTGVQAKGISNDEKSIQGVIVLVDRTNTQSITFSLLDHMGTSTMFHLTPKTRFTAHQSASQLVPNLLARVSGQLIASGEWNATLISLQHNTTSFPIQGVVASVQTNQTIDLALTDGTVAIVHLSSQDIAPVHAGMQLLLQAAFTPSHHALQAQKVHIQTPHAKHYQVRGLLSHINTRTHRLSLLTSQGSTFSLLQAAAPQGKAHQAGALHIGENITVSGTTDTQGNLDAQQVTVNAGHKSRSELIGTVTALDTTTNSISVVDQDGNVTSLTTSATLLTSLQVGNTYQFSVTLASDGTLTAVKIDTADGSDKGTSLDVGGVVQSYDASSKILSLLGENDQIFSLQVTDQTIITGNDGAAASLQQGQAAKVKTQVNADGTYTALTIEIQDMASQGDSMTFVGSFLSYDMSSDQLTLTLESSNVIITTTAQTQIEGAASLSTIPAGTLLRVDAQIQQDGSYRALSVGVKEHHDGGSDGGNGEDHRGKKR